MARGCKCTHCKKQLNTDIAYKVTTNGRNKYYCSEEEYNQIQEEINSKIKCLETISSILKIPFVQPMMLKEINSLRKFYGYIVIEKTFKDNSENIKWFLENKKNGSEFGKIRYITTIIKNNINSTFKKYVEEQKELDRMFNKSEKDIKNMDIDIMNDNENIQTITNKGIDISMFLD